MRRPAITIRIAAADGHYGLALAHAPLGVWAWAHGDRVLTLSPSCLALVHAQGEDEAQIIRLMHADDIVRLDASFAEFLHSKRDRFTFRFRAGVGEHRSHFEATGIVERNRAGKVLRLSGWMMETAHTPGFSETVLDSLPSPVFVKDERERRWIGVNDAFAKMLGRPINETLGLRDADLFAPEQAAHFERMDNEVFEIGGNTVEEPITTDGEQRWLLTKKTLTSLPTGERILVGVITDITERRHAEEELERAHEAALEASRTKSRFLANMSHEIRTPLNGVLGMVESIETSTLSQEQREALEIIRSSGDTLLAVINDILDFSKLEAGAMVVENIDFSPRDVAEDVTRLLADAAKRRSLELIVDVYPDVPAIVTGDPTRTRQILFNLVGNALKFSRDGAILVEVRRAPDDQAAIDFRVVDPGIGIPSEKVDELFNAFVQADDSTTRKFGGTGLGLSICHQLAVLMHGSLHVETEVDVGSIFTFRLPCADVDATFRPERIVGRVALIDIPTQIAIPLARTLVASGAYVLAVTKAAEVPKDFDVVIVNGRQGAERAIDTLARRNIPVPLLMLRGPDDGAFSGASLSRPIVSNELRRALRAAIGQPIQEDRDAETHALPLLNLSVLVAEDNRINQLVARRMLARIGVAVDVVETGRDAVAAAGQREYDAILMDCHMPVMDGFDATIKIRAMKGHYRTVPIIALTASALGSERERCLAAGMSDHVPKPVRLEELHRVLSSWCGVRTP